MTITEICNILKEELYNNDYKYGFYLNGKQYTSNFEFGFDKEFENLLHSIYIIQAPADTMREKIGTCMDEVVLMSYLLKNHNVTHKIWLLLNRLKNRVHTILTFEAEDKVVYLELTPQYNKPWYGKEIIYTSERDFLEDFCANDYDVLDITDKIKEGESPLLFLPYKYKLIRHYNKLIEENNDPVHDPKSLKVYMDKWDGLTFVDQLRLDTAKRVLEIGVGTGRLAIKTAPLCKSFCGIDISPMTIERAKNNLFTYKNVNLICDDFFNHKFDSLFDVIYSSLTFMHFKNKQQVIDKIASLLNVGGRFILSIDKNQNKIIDIGTSKIEIYPDNPKDIEECIKTAGLDLNAILETEFAYIFVATKLKH